MSQTATTTAPAEPTPAAPRLRHLASAPDRLELFVLENGDHRVAFAATWKPVPPTPDGPPAITWTLHRLWPPRPDAAAIQAILRDALAQQPIPGLPAGHLIAAVTAEA